MKENLSCNPPSLVDIKNIKKKKHEITYKTSLCRIDLVKSFVIE